MTVSGKLDNKYKYSALSFVIIMGIVSLLSDMTHEGARSIYGVYLHSLGASAAVIGFVAGAGQLVGHVLRLVTGMWADKYKQYWLMTIAGYLMNMFAIPALALVGPNGWVWACSLIILERVGKAIRQPAKNTLVSFAASTVGAGKSFAIQEALDQIGAFLGPVLLFVVLYMTKLNGGTPNYALCFAVLGIPAVLTILCLLWAKHRYPTPEDFEKEQPIREHPGGFAKIFILYLIGSAFMAFGFIDFPLITMHAARHHIVSDPALPLLYAWAMLADAAAALIFGWMFDKKGIGVLLWAVLLSSVFSLFAFGSTVSALFIGATLWGIGMGAQESILKSTVAVLVPKNRRSTGFGVFGLVFGVSWFVGSWLLGYLYDRSVSWMIAVSILSQLAAAVFFVILSRTQRKPRSETSSPQ